jgi:Transglycosylase SLT domain
VAHSSTEDSALADDWPEPDAARPRRRRRWLLLLLVLPLVAGLGALAVVGIGIGRSITQSVASASDRVRNGLALDGPGIDPAAARYRAYARTQLGSTSEQFDCLDNLWTSESGWRPTAQNPDSTAYGIAQLLDQTWVLMAADKTSDPYDQIDVGLRYIDKRYGTPCDAWDFWLAHHWY